MNQDIACNRAIESIKVQIGGLTPRMETVISHHLYLLYTIGYESSNKIKKTCKPVNRIDSKGTIKPFSSLTEAAKSIGTTKGDIWRALNGKRRQKMVRGYKFEYSNN